MRSPPLPYPSSQRPLPDSWSSTAFDHANRHVPPASGPSDSSGSGPRPPDPSSSTTWPPTSITRDSGPVSGARASPWSGSQTDVPSEVCTNTRPPAVATTWTPQPLSCAHGTSVLATSRPASRAYRCSPTPASDMRAPGGERLLGVAGDARVEPGLFGIGRVAQKDLVAVRRDQVRSAVGADVEDAVRRRRGGGVERVRDVVGADLDVTDVQVFRLVGGVVRDERPEPADGRPDHLWGHGHGVVAPGAFATDLDGDGGDHRHRDRHSRGRPHAPAEQLALSAPPHSLSIERGRSRLTDVLVQRIAHDPLEAHDGPPVLGIGSWGSRTRNRRIPAEHCDLTVPGLMLSTRAISFSLRSS